MEQADVGRAGETAVLLARVRIVPRYQADEEYMKIGFDVSQTGSAKAGCGYFADSLIKHMSLLDAENVYSLYRTFGDSFWDSKIAEITAINRPNFKYGRTHNSLEEARYFWRKAPPDDIKKWLGCPDIVHANNFFCPENRIANTAYVYTLYDLSFVDFPEWTTESNRVACFTGVFNASVTADFIIAISEYSRRHYLSLFPHYPPDRISVVSLASRFETGNTPARPDRFSNLTQGRFWLSVGTIEPRKNHKILLQSYARLKSLVKNPMPLVLAGGKGWMMENFDETLQEMGLSEDVLLLGYVSDTELEWLYQNCFAFVYPSLFEGFGLPVLEAMSKGAPVITSNVSSIPEIVADAGVLIDPTDSDDLFHAMLKLVNGAVNRENLRKMAVDRAKMFSWTRAASSMLEIYQDLLDKKLSTTEKSLNN